MPVIDWPLEELRRYKGINPCPKDFDSFWDGMLAKLDGHQANPVLTPAAFRAPNAECFDLYFTGLDGSRVYAKYQRPVKAEKAPAILNFHGYHGSSGEWWDKLAWVNAGFAVASMDCRGQGGLSEDLGAHNPQIGRFIRGIDGPPEDMLFVKNFLDTVLLARIVGGFDEVDQSRLHAMGSSQGGALAVACAALAPGVIRVSAGYPFLSDYKRVWQMDIHISAYNELYEYFRQFDPLHKREGEIFEKLGYIDIQNLAKRIKGEVLWACGLTDTICPPSTQFAAYNKIAAKKTMLIYPDFGHEGLPGYVDEIYRFFCAE
ncbi:MAG: acetylxylan esterase [Clostridiales bacterium]|jgi:cephalosporin-C deacetylase|nr:acetylxylan esterase [Clostridiales bacterium]